MSDPFTGEIRMFGGSYAPVNWSFCNGNVINVSQNDALFSLIGTTYGGNGRTTFGLPDLQGRLPMHYGTGPGLTHRNLGSKGGAETVTLSTNNIPSHTHTAQGSGDAASSTSPSGNVLAQHSSNFYETNPDAAKLVDFPTAMVENTGLASDIANRQPFLAINFIICLAGIYPTRT